MFDDVQSFLAMGGYGFFIWSSYAVCFGGLALLAWNSWALRRQRRAEITRLETADNNAQAR